MREDGEWYALGNMYEWRLSFAVFPGCPDGAVLLTPEDTCLLGLRLDGNEPLAADIIRWASGKKMWFKSELDPEIEPGVEPSPLTGSIKPFMAPG